MSRTTARRPAMVALTIVGLLSGCSSAGNDSTGAGPQIATLQSGAAKAQPSGNAEDRRPLIRLDASDQDRDALYAVWEKCVTEKGGPGYEQAKIVYLKIKEGDKKAKEVQAACHASEPETYEERQLRTDLPAFLDNQHEFYQCARQAGYQLTAPDPDTGEFGLAKVGPLGDWDSATMQECRRQSFRD